MAGSRDRNLRGHFAAPNFIEWNQQLDASFNFLTGTGLATMVRALFSKVARIAGRPTGAP
jgi:hypothetical protein